MEKKLKHLFKFYLFCHPVDVVIEQGDRISERQLQEESM